MKFVNDIFKTPLSLAVENNDVEIIKCLLSYENVDVNHLSILI